MARDLKSILALMLVASAMSPNDRYCSYGGIDMCITCKKNGRDKYKDEETGQEFDFCESCPNNMTNAYKEEKAMGLTEGHWFEDEEELTERQLENWVADNKAAYKKGLIDGKPKWISVNDRLPNDIIVCQSFNDKDAIQYKIPNVIHEYLVTDGQHCAVGHWRPDAKAWDSFSFGWIEKDSTEDGVLGIGKVTHWMPLPDRP